MSKVKIFEDGTSIKWIDKETLKYIENEYSIDIWVDFEPEFLITVGSSNLHPYFIGKQNLMEHQM